MNIVKRIFSLCLISTLPLQARVMQEQQVAALVDVVFEKTNQYLADNNAIVKKLTIWQDEATGLKMDLSIPVSYEETRSVMHRLREHQAAHGAPETYQPFIAIVKNNSEYQLCGAMGYICGNVLFLDALAMPTNDDVFLLQELMQHVTLFAAQNKAAKIYLRLSNQENILIKNLLANNFIVDGQITDRFNGGLMYGLSKQIKEEASLNISNNSFAFQWVSTADYFKNKASFKTASFFEPHLQLCMKELLPEPKPTLSIGFNIYDKANTWLGGGSGNFYLNATTPHVYLQGLWFNPSIRGKGLARGMLTAAETLAKKLGCKQATTRTVSVLAPDLYPRLGYKIEYEGQAATQKPGQTDNKIYFFYKDLYEHDIKKDETEHQKLQLPEAAALNDLFMKSQKTKIQLTDQEFKTVQHYNKHGAEWIQKRGPQKNSPWLNEVEEFHRLLPGGKILEIGVGAGKEARALLEKGFDYVGIDASQTVLEEAKKYLPTDTTLICTSVYDLPYKDNSFDGFWTAATLLHIPKHRIADALQSIRRVTKNGGVGFISLCKGTGEAVDDTGRTDCWFALYQQEEFTEILKCNGFEVIANTSIGFPSLIAGFRDWLGFFVRVIKKS